METHASGFSLNGLEKKKRTFGRKNVLAALESARTALTESSAFHSPVAWRRKTAEMGVPALDLPKSVGGAEWLCRDMAEVFAWCGHKSLDLRDVPGGGHARFLLFPRDGRHQEELRRAGNGEAFFAIAITEPDAGSDLHGIRMVAEPLPGGSYRISGRKCFNARVEEATHVIIFAKVPRNGVEPMITAFLLPMGISGMRRFKSTSLGLNGVSFGGFDLCDVRVPGEMRIGGEGQGLALFVQHFTYWRAAMAAAAIGCARSGIDQAMKWLRWRNAFGGRLGRFTHLQQELVEHVSRLHMSWLLVLAVMERIDHHLPAFADACMAKAEALDSATRAVEWAIRIHGARGVTTEFDLEKRLRDLVSLSIADGTRDVLRGQVARALLGNDLYEESLGRQRSSRGGLTSQTSRRFW